MSVASPRTPFFPSTSASRISAFLATSANGLIILLSFCVVSSAIVIHNKYLLDRHDGIFPHSMLLMWLQTVTAFVTLAGLQVSGILAFRIEWRSPGDWATGIIYVMSVFTGLLSLSFVTIPIFSALKRLGLLVSWLIEYFFSRRPETRKTFSPLVMMLAGISIAGSADLKFNFMGYFFGIASCITASSSFELSRHVAEAKNKGVWAVLMMNSVVTLVILTPYLVWSGDLAQFANPFSWSREAKIHVPLNCAFCFLLNFLIFKNVSVNTALTHVVSGNAKTIMTTVIGALLMDSQLTMMGWLGIAVSFVGAIWFSLLKSKAAIQKEWHPSFSSSTQRNDNGDDVDGDDQLKEVVVFSSGTKDRTKVV